MPRRWPALHPLRLLSDFLVLLLGMGVLIGGAVALLKVFGAIY
jgi:hypothetical protein